jgi:hypothetical protein
MTRDQHRAFMISALEKFLRLLREMFLSPRAINAVGREGEQSKDDASGETPSPAKKKLPPCDCADIAKAILTFGILHYDEG